MSEENLSRGGIFAPVEAPTVKFISRNCNKGDVCSLYVFLIVNPLHYCNRCQIKPK